MPLFVKEKQPYFIFIFLIFIAYLPLLSGMMAIKSDSLLVSYPIFYFFGNQLQHGSIPFWNYNLNGGFPMHAEVGSLFWNFSLWIFPLLSKSLYTYTLEIALHIIIAAIGVFKLSQYLKLSRLVSSFTMFCYVCSGFFVAHLQHANNIFESAFIPYVLLFFLRTVFTPNLKNSIYLCISLFFLINSGYPGFPISMLYFLIFLFIGIIISTHNTKNIAFLVQALKYLMISVFLAALLCLPLFVSYLEISNSYFRANSFKSELISYGGGMTFKSLLSFFWPFAAPVDPKFYKTDVAWNNIYIGIIFSAFFLLSLIKVRNALKWPLFFAGFLMLLFSFQGDVKHFFYSFLPLLGLVRSNGEFRIYFILIAIIIGGQGMERLLEKNKPALKKVFIYTLILQLFAIAVILAKYYNVLFEFLKRIHLMPLRILVFQLNAPSLIFVQSVFNISLLIVAIIFLKQKRNIYVLICFDILASFFFNLPFSGLSTKSTQFIQSNIDESVNQINNPKETYIISLDGINCNNKYVIAPAQFLNNGIKIDYSGYPAMFKTYYNLMKTGRISDFEKKQTVFFSKQKPDSGCLQNLLVKNNSISFNIVSKAIDSIILFQNYHTNWSCEIDGQKAIITKTNDGFMEEVVKPGKHHFYFKYWPRNPIIAFFITIIIWFILIAYLLRINFLKRLKSNIHKI